MHGIFLAIDSNHLSRTNSQVALEGWNKFQPSISICNHYLNEAIIHDEDEVLPKLEDVDVARRILAMMIQTAIKRGTDKFSLKAFNEFLAQAARGQKPMEFISIAEQESKQGKPVIEFDIGEPTVIEKAVAEITEAPKVEIPKKVEALKPQPKLVEVTQPKPALIKPQDSEKSGRGRKTDPNSPNVRRVAVFREATDQSREAIIALYMRTFNLPQGTAQTYFYNTCKDLGIKPSDAGKVKVN